MEEYFPTVVQAVAGSERTVYAYFSNGEIRRFDVAPMIRAGSVFERLREDSFFRDAITVLNGTVAWDVSGHFDPASCIDLDPFTLYDAEVVSDPLEETG